MQALNDGQHIAAVEAKVDRLERKVDGGFGRLETKIDAGFVEMRARVESTETALRTEINEVRSEARGDFRTLIAVILSLWVATVLTVLAAHL
jgi:hypothetical protein